MLTKQAEIIRTLKVKPVIDPASEVRLSVDFIKDYLKETGLKTLVLGISGGQDSTLVGRLAQIAAEELRVEEGTKDYQFIAVRLPYGVQLDEEDAKAALSFIQADVVYTVNIKEATDNIVKELKENGLELSNYHIGNIKARQRMLVQYAIAGQTGGVVLGSDHAAEAVTGFYTKYGDGAADIMPIWRLNKRQGAKLLEYLGAESKLYEKIPTADLEDDKPLQADEEALGISYKEIDDYLEGKEISEASRIRLESLYDKSEHKRRLPRNIYDTW